MSKVKIQLVLMIVLFALSIAAICYWYNSRILELDNQLKSLKM
jgi:hypothetical protein